MAARPPKQIDNSSYSGRFAERLRSLREKAGLSVDEVIEAMAADGYKVARRSFYNWELATNTPPLDAFPAIAKALGLKTARNLLPEN